MILFGSEAAKRSGLLPRWRDPLTVNDYDLCGSDEEFEALAKHLERYGSVMTADRGSGYKAIFVHDRMNRLISVDWLCQDEPSALMPVEGRSTIFDGIPIDLVDLQTHYVTKLACADFSPFGEKVRRDLDHFRREILDRGLSLSDDHTRLLEVIKVKYKQRFATTS